VSVVMKKLILFTWLCWVNMLLYQAQAQDNLWYSSSNFYEPQIMFTNPAGLAFQEHRQAIFSSQLLYTGLSDDNLYNHYLGYIEPIKKIGVFGLRSSHFNSLMLNQNYFSLLYGKTVINSKLGLGINFNLLQYSVDKKNLQRVDLDDPLLKNTSKFVFGAGFGLIYNPITDFAMGISIDNFNRPDISLEGGKAKKPLSANFGVSYRIFNLVPELDVKYFHYSQRNETYLVFGLKQLLLDNSANLSIQYHQNCFSVGGAYTFKNFRLDYNYTYPLNELQEICNGSHQFTLSYNFGKYRGYPTAPKISLISPQDVEVDTSYHLFQTQVTDKRGIKQIKVQLNDEAITIYDYTGTEKLVTLDIPMSPLNKVDNRIKIIASNGVKQSSKKIIVNYKAPDTIPVIVSSPKIEILTPIDKETASSSMRLKFSLEFVLELKDFKIKVNGKEIKLRGIQTLSKEKDKMDLEAEFNLEEGNNEIELIAYNQRGSGSQKRKIRYNPITESFYNKLWGVVIGIDNYRNKDVEDLSYAVHDAKGVEKLLMEHYQFDHIITLYNNDASKENIIRAISTDLKDAKEDDGIFIFFAGHGSTGEGITGGPLGYIVPVDGTFNESEFYVKNIPMSTVKEISQTIKAKHIYYVMDCCYGGLLLRGGMDRKEPVMKADYNFLKSLAKNSVRQVLTAGGKGQPVLDGGLAGHSVFTGRFIQGLEGEADINEDGFITAEELNFFVRQRVYADVDDIVRGHPIYRDVEQTPQYGKWFGEGEFIFRASSK
jgi:hypothetical protein